MIQLEIRDLDDDTAHVCPLDELLQDNAEDVEFCEAVSKLLPGEAVTFGGGAAPYIQVRRLT